MTTLKPRKPYTEEELRQLYPGNLELQLVQVLLRHGERTPVSARFQKAGLPAFWPYCSVARQMRSGVLDGSGTFTTLEWRRRLEAFGQDDSPTVATGPRGEVDDVCDMGTLTDVGRQTALSLGQRLRHLYVDQLHFLPPSISSPDFLYLRATPIPRTMESLHQVFTGLYPEPTREGAAEGKFPPPTMLTRTQGDETLFPNDTNCRRFAHLSQAFAQRTADRWNATEEMEYLNKIYGKWMPDRSPRVAVDGHPRMSGILDTINATLGHGPETRLPREFYDRRALEILDKIEVEEWYSGYAESHEYRMLGVGSMLGDVVARMVGSVERTAADGEYEIAGGPGPGSAAAGIAPIKFGLSGCHDTTLAATLASLGAFENRKWPPYTSHIAIELFRDAKTPPTAAAGDSSQRAFIPPNTAASKQPRFWSLFSPGSLAGTAPPGIRRKLVTELTDAERAKMDGYYVRLRYNDEPVTIPGCRASGNHLEGDESFCTLTAFKAIVDKFTPRNWKQQCHMNLGAPSFPSEPEPSGY